MKAILITILIVEILQIVGLFAAVMTDATVVSDDNLINSKKDVIKFLIPFFWFIPLVVAILTWWKKLP